MALVTRKDLFAVPWTWLGLCVMCSIDESTLCVCRVQRLPKGPGPSRTRVKKKKRGMRMRMSMQGNLTGPRLCGWGHHWKSRNSRCTKCPATAQHGKLHMLSRRLRQQVAVCELCRAIVRRRPGWSPTDRCWTCCWNPAPRSRLRWPPPSLACACLLRLATPCVEFV